MVYLLEQVVEEVESEQLEVAFDEEELEHYDPEHEMVDEVEYDTSIEYSNDIKHESMEDDSCIMDSEQIIAYEAHETDHYEGVEHKIAWEQRQR